MFVSLLISSQYLLTSDSRTSKVSGLSKMNLENPILLFTTLMVGDSLWDRATSILNFSSLGLVFSNHLEVFTIPLSCLLNTL